MPDSPSNDEIQAELNLTASYFGDPPLVLPEPLYAELVRRGIVIPSTVVVSKPIPIGALGLKFRPAHDTSRGPRGAARLKSQRASSSCSRVDS
jgi:hypothetical protein